MSHADTGPPSLEITLDHSSRTLDEASLARRLRRTIDAEGFRLRYLSVVLTDHATVHYLNRTFLAHDYVTDVLSFALDEEACAEGFVDGEVYVDLDTAAERAPEFGTTFEDEASRYAIHGLLHLMGHDDATDDQRAAMRTLEDTYLSAP